MKKTTINFLHLGYWLLVLVQTLLVSLGTGVLGTTFDWRLFSQIVLPVKFLQVLSAAIFFYINYLYLIPVCLKKGNIIKYLFAIIGTLFLFAPIYYLLEQHFYPLIGWKSYDADLNFWFAVMITLSSNFINIFLAILLSYLMDWRTMRLQKEIVEKEQFKTELAFLRSQVNPHYLFNTINDIYALSQQQSTEAPNALLKLSELLRYMLRESDEQFVPLSKEIIYLENVIELQKIGQKGLSYVDFEVVGKIDELKIAPLILINFVENAFKHGTFSNENNPISILIIIEGNSLHLQVTNQINQVKKDKTGGIGLVNVKRRLSLIYPEKHVLKIHQVENEFIVNLKIALHD